jgi:hypothetical protein
VTVVLSEIRSNDRVAFGINNMIRTNIRIMFTFRGQQESYGDHVPVSLGPTTQAFHSTHPNHNIVLFSARRKAQMFSHDISLNAQNAISGTLQTLYSRIDLLATWGHPQHDMFCEAVERVVGLKITMRASSNWKEAGFYFDRDTFVTLDRMATGFQKWWRLLSNYVQRNIRSLF